MDFTFESIPKEIESEYSKHITKIKEVEDGILLFTKKIHLTKKIIY